VASCHMAGRSENYYVPVESPCVASLVPWPYSGQVLRNIRPIALFEILTLFLLASTQAVWALTGPECLAVCEKGSLSEVESMLEQHTPVELSRVRDPSGRGLLHYCIGRDRPFWEVLLNAGWPVKLERGWTPQHEACLIGNLEALRLLRERGASVSVKEPHNGGTPLHVASFNGHLALVQYLVKEGADVNARDNEGWTPLSQARDQGFPKIVDWLKQNGATR
jgi:ankyrin repeat protein